MPYKSEKRKKITELLVDFLHEEKHPSNEYYDWLRKQTNFVSLFDYYAEKIMKVK